VNTLLRVFSQSVEPEQLGCLTWIIIYFYFSLCVYVIARKTETENSWWAFIPLLNIILVLLIGDKPVWWVFLCFVPLLNLLIVALIWMGVAEVRCKPSWLGGLMVLPGVNLIVIGYLAFSR